MPGRVSSACPEDIMFRLEALPSSVSAEGLGERVPWFRSV